MSAWMRWLTFGVGLLAFVFVGARPAPAHPAAPADLACRWSSLASGERRAYHALDDYPSRGVITFGGEDIRAGESTLKDDVHVLDLSAGAPGTWRQVTITGSGPEDRTDHAAALRTKPAGGFELIVYGGSTRAHGSSGARPESDTWRLDLTPAGGTWSSIDLTGSPERAEHTMIYRPAADAMITFGGRHSASSGSVVNDTMRLVFDSTPSWEVVDVGPSLPAARAAHSAVYDPDGDRMIIFGGRGASGQELADAWALNFAGDVPTWERLAVEGTVPTGRAEHAAAYIPSLRRMVVYGGTRSGAALADLYTLDVSSSPAVWERHTLSGNRPAELRGARAAFSSVLGAVVLFGGVVDPDADDASNRAWALTCSDDSSTPVPTTPGGPTPGPTTVTPPPPTTQTPTVTPSTPPPTTPPGPSATPSATEPSANIDLSGLVYDASRGASAPLEGARLVVPPCQTPHQSFEARSGADGRYRLTLPAGYFVPGCTVTVTVTLAGYEDLVRTFTYDELRNTPERDFGLTPVAPTVTPVPQNIDLHGVVYDADQGTGTTIAGARIVVPPCRTPHQSFETTSDATGAYTLTLPAAYFVPGCTIEITVTKDGYEPLTEQHTYEQLLADPQRSFGLRPTPIIPPEPIFLPYLAKRV